MMEMGLKKHKQGNLNLIWAVCLRLFLKSRISLQILPVLVCQEDISVCTGCAQQQHDVSLMNKGLCRWIPADLTHKQTLFPQSPATCCNLMSRNMSGNANSFFFPVHCLQMHNWYQVLTLQKLSKIVTGDQKAVFAKQEEISPWLCSPVNLAGHVGWVRAAAPCASPGAYKSSLCYSLDHFSWLV